MIATLPCLFLSVTIEQHIFTHRLAEITDSVQNGLQIGISGIMIKVGKDHQP